MTRPQISSGGTRRFPGLTGDVVADGCYDDGGFGVCIMTCGAACFGGCLPVDGDGAAGGFAVVIGAHRRWRAERRFAGAGEVPSSRTFSPGLIVRLESADDGFWASGVVPAEVVELDAAPARCCFHDGSLAFVRLLLCAEWVTW